MAGNQTSLHQWLNCLFTLVDEILVHYCSSFGSYEIWVSQPQSILYSNEFMSESQLVRWIHLVDHIVMALTDSPSYFSQCHSSYILIAICT